MVVGGELKDSGTNGTSESHWRNKKGTYFQLENLRRGTLVDLGLDELLHTT